jgi:thiol-disulfide isomerase/thioredoxin
VLVRPLRQEKKMSKLIMFHARECPHCRVMMPLVDRLEDDEKNADLMRSYRADIAPKCGGQLRTPTFFNPETKDVLCGEVPYEKLKDWALKQG